MTTADLVNLICDKLRTGRVEFVCVTSRMPCWVEFIYGGNNYSAHWLDTGRIEVLRWFGEDDFIDNYSKWIEGILNGLVRDDDGNMVPK